ncbi:hypothetical protein QCA50_003927 [Cerrena zonata]|uniref:Aminotransferase-like plant mobile domain-containing protein n=1 Tax=Cerrena zonata TaxID=2478898 RepID=A0AAW0GHY2_9APHY
MSSSQSQWLMTAQGATVNGINATTDIEVAVWSYTTFLRDSIFSYPDGTTPEEYEEYIEGLYQVWKDDTQEQRIQQTPILVARFLELVERYRKDKVPFDLLESFVYQYHSDASIIYDDIALPVTTSARISTNGRRWIEGLYARWASRRRDHGIPDLSIDRTVYLGRLTPDRFDDMKKRKCEIWDFGGPEALPKLPVRHDMSSATAEHTSDENEMEVDHEVLDQTEIQEEQSGYDFRGSTLQRRGQNQDPPEQTIPNRGPKSLRRESTKGKQREQKVESPEQEEDDSNGESHTSSDSYEECGVPSSRVYKATSKPYWKGDIALRKRYWLWKRCNRRLFEWQQAVAPCKNCARNKLPCMIYLALNPGCIACMTSVGKRSCSFVAAMATGHVHLPYSHVIGVYFHTMMISHFMQGLPLLLWPQNFAKVNFYPGIVRGTTEDYLIPKDQVATTKKTALENYNLLSKGNWEPVWYGLPYDDAYRAYSERSSRKPEVRSRYDESVWTIDHYPTVYDMEMVEEYYKMLDAVISRPKWSAYDIYGFLPFLPVVACEPPPGKLRQRHKPPQDRDMSEEEWIEHLVAGGDEEYVSDTDYEDEENPPSGDGGLAQGDIDTPDDGTSGDEVDLIDVDNDAESAGGSGEGGSGQDSDDNSEHSFSADNEETDAPLLQIEGPSTPQRKYTMKETSTDVGSSDKTMTSKASSAGPQTPDATVRRIMAATQSPTRRGRKRGAATVPSREIGRIYPTMSSPHNICISYLPAPMLSDEDVMDVDEREASGRISSVTLRKDHSMKKGMKGKSDSVKKRSVKRARFEDDEGPLPALQVLAIQQSEAVEGDGPDIALPMEKTRGETVNEGFADHLENNPGVNADVRKDPVVQMEELRGISLDDRFVEIENAIVELEEKVVPPNIAKRVLALFTPEGEMPSIAKTIKNMQESQVALRKELESTKAAFSKYQEEVEARFEAYRNQVDERILTTIEQQVQDRLTAILDANLLGPKVDSSPSAIAGAASSAIPTSTTSLPPSTSAGAVTISPARRSPTMAPSSSGNQAGTMSTTSLERRGAALLPSSSLQSNLSISQAPQRHRSVPPMPSSTLFGRTVSTVVHPPLSSALSALTALSDLPTPLPSVAPSRIPPIIPRRAHSELGPRQDDIIFGGSISDLRISEEVRTAPILEEGELNEEEDGDGMEN